MSTDSDNRPDEFDFFPELLEKNTASETVVYDSEEDAFDDIFQRTAQNSGEEDVWPPADPGDFPGAVPEPPAPEPVEEFPEPVTEDVVKPVSDRVLRRMALGFLAGKHPDILGQGVRTILPRINLDAAAVCLGPGTGIRRSIHHTLLVVAASEPERCLMPRAQRQRTESDLAEQLKRKEELEAMIRNTEPELNASLFFDAAEWDYSRSKSVKYHRCLRKIEKLRYDLQFTGKLDRILAEGIANENYLLVPEGVEIPDSIPQQWGIVQANRDYSMTLLRPAVFCDSTEEMRQVFTLFTASAGADDVQFANGVTVLEKDKILLSPVPRKRPPFTH